MPANPPPLRARLLDPSRWRRVRPALMVFASAGGSGEPSAAPPPPSLSRFFTRRASRGAARLSDDWISDGRISDDWISDGRSSDDWISDGRLSDDWSGEPAGEPPAPSVRRKESTGGSDSIGPGAAPSLWPRPCGPGRVAQAVWPRPCGPGRVAQARDPGPCGPTDTADGGAEGVPITGASAKPRAPAAGRQSPQDPRDPQ